jgi:hypothetical protein
MKEYAETKIINTSRTWFQIYSFLIKYVNYIIIIFIISYLI